MFENVYGYKSVKKELMLLKDWYSDATILDNPKITLPRGVLLYGSPGNGKTLLMREFLDSFDCPKYVLGEEDELDAKEIRNVFSKAKKDPFAIILIDEFELVLDEKATRRALQQEMDGITQKGSLLVLAATNDIHNVPDPFLRPGRFDKVILIDRPDRKSREAIFRCSLDWLGADCSKLDLSETARFCDNVSGAEIKAICNDAYLHHPDQPLENTDIEAAYGRIHDRRIEEKEDYRRDYCIAMHEAGHTLMALRHREDWCFRRAGFNKRGGITQTTEVEEDFVTFRKRSASIQIGLAGCVAEEVMFGHYDFGCASDFETVHDLCRRMVERSCIYGLGYHITEADETNYYHRHTQKTEARIEKKTYHLIHRFKRQTKRYLKHHKGDLRKIADFIMKEGELTQNDVATLGLSI